MTPSAPVPISVFLITLNEEDRVGAAIHSAVEWADEVIVVDSGSTDKTIQIAKDAGACVIHRDFDGYGEQKRFAEDQCRNQWLLNLDADEILTEEAQEEIQDLLASGKITQFDCWRIVRKTAYPHEEVPPSWAFRDDPIRVYDRTKARFSTSIVHDSVLPEKGASVGQIDSTLTHYSHRSIDFQVIKFNRYAEMQVKDMMARGRRLPRWRLLTEFPLSFLKSYIIRRQIFYGFWGFSLAMSYAYSRFLRVAKFHEKELLAKAEEKRRKK